MPMRMPLTVMRKREGITSIYIVNGPLIGVYVDLHVDPSIKKYLRRRVPYIQVKMTGVESLHLKIGCNTIIIGLAL